MAPFVAPAAPRSLRYQLLRLVVVVVALANSISMLSTLMNDWNLHREQASRSLETTARSAAIAVTAAVAFADEKAATLALRELAPQKEIMAAAVYQLDGKRLAFYGQAKLLPLDVHRIKATQPDPTPLSTSASVQMPIVIDGTTVGQLLLRADLSDYRESFLRHALIALLASLVGLGVSVWLGARFIERITLSVRELAGLAHLVRLSEDYSLRATVPGGGETNKEISELLLSFNAMLAEIEKRKNQLKKYQRGLEDRVLARTRELAAANAALQAEIHHRGLSEAKIRASEEKLRSLYELAPLGIALTTLQGRYVEFNAALEAICGYPAEELKRLDYWTLTPEKYRAEELAVLDALRRTGRYGPFEKEYRRKDGSLVPINLNGRLVTGADGQTYIWSLIEDISQRKQAEAALRAEKQFAEEADQAKSRFLAAASHDLRQPLHALGLLNTALIERIEGMRVAAGDADHGEILRLARLIDASMHNMANLLNDLLDLSRLDAGVLIPRPECVRVHDLFKRLHDRFLPMALDKGVGLRFMPCRLAVESDPVMLDRVLANLIANAIRYTVRGGVLVGVRRRERDTLRIEVIDTGPGIPEEFLGRVFEEYFQLGNPERDRDKGQGLGLSIVQRMTTLLGVPIVLSSRLGHGTRFGLHLRRCEFSERAGKGERDGGPGLLPGQGKLVVLVDDDAAILAAMRSLFAQWGIDLIAEPSLEAAKAALAASGRAPNLILSDYRLPGEHDGIAVVAQCRALFGEDLPGVLITGDTGKEAIQAIDQSELRVMHKPLQPAKLRALLTHLLGSA